MWSKNNRSDFFKFGDMIFKIKFKLQGSNSNFYIFIKKLFFYMCHCQYSLKMTISTQLSYIRTGKTREYQKDRNP